MDGRYRAVTDAGVAIWAAVDDHPLGVLYLPTSSDAILHAVIAAVVALGIVLAVRKAGRAPSPA